MRTSINASLPYPAPGPTIPWHGTESCPSRKRSSCMPRLALLAPAGPARFSCSTHPPSAHSTVLARAPTRGHPDHAGACETLARWRIPAGCSLTRTFSSWRVAAQAVPAGDGEACIWPCSLPREKGLPGNLKATGASICKQGEMPLQPSGVVVIALAIAGSHMLQQDLRHHIGEQHVLVLL